MHDGQHVDQIRFRHEIAPGVAPAANPYDAPVASSVPLFPACFGEIPDVEKGLAPMQALPPTDMNARRRQEGRILEL
jgi:hypothetical protein